MARPKRKDKTRTVLRTGELQRSDGSYQYSWTDENHKRRYVYSKTLEALRIKEEAIEKDKSDGIKAEARYVTLDDLYELWKDLKRGLKNNTFENYKYIYETFVRRQIGSKRVSTFLKSDIKRFYNYLVDERGLKPATVDGVHNILHQIFDMAVDDNYIRNNPTNNVLRELKKAHCFKTEKRRGLTRPEQELFMDYLKNSNTAVYWYPVFAVMLGTGLRVGEVTGLRWCDIDLEDGIIDVNHTLVYYDHRTSEGKKGCYFNVNTTKTPASMRQVPMLDFVKEAFELEKQKHIKAADIDRIAEQIESFKARRRELEPQLENARKELEDSGEDVAKLEPIEISIEEITSKIQRLEKKMAELGDVNMRALAAYDEVLARQSELKEQIETLSKERKEILERMQGYEQLKKETFMKTYNHINENFKEVFHQLSEGEGELKLECPDDPLSGGMTIEAQPRDKKLQRLESMSGGEKSLTALAFVFAIQRYMPSPFYAFDEVDASLDTMNVERIAQMVQNQSKDTQFIVVSHRRPMIESANRTLGVTQKEKGITKVTGIKLRDEE